MGFCVRPVTRWGVRRHDLFQSGRPVVVPGRKVEFNLSDAAIRPPHVEDESLYPRSIVDKGACSDAEWESVLRESCSPSAADMFDGKLQEGRYVLPGEETQSLGTVGGVLVEYVKVEDRHGRRRYRMSFRDAVGGRYAGMPVNDLTFRASMQRSIDVLGDEIEAEEAVLEALLDADRTYLRIGLARPRQLEQYPQACWTQVTGVYTFPDYLEGKTFADFL